MISALSPSDHYPREMKRSHSETPINDDEVESTNTSCTTTKANASLSSSTSIQKQVPLLSAASSLVLSSNKAHLGQLNPPFSFEPPCLPNSTSNNSHFTQHTKIEASTTLSMPALEAGTNVDSNDNPKSFMLDQIQSSSSSFTSSSQSSLYNTSRRRASLVFNHHQITLDQSTKMLSDDDSTASSSSLSESLTSYRRPDTITSIFPSIREESDIEDDAVEESDCLPRTFRPVSSVPLLSLLYSDTAPRDTWRPQLESWLKKNHPSQLREIERAPSPKPIVESLKTHWSYTAITHKHSAQLREIRRKSRPRLTASQDLIVPLPTRNTVYFSDTDNESDEHHHSRVSGHRSSVRKSASHSALRSPRKKISAQNRDAKPYSRTSPSASAAQLASITGNHPRPRSNSNNTGHHIIQGPVLTISPAEQNFTVNPVPTNGHVPLASGRPTNHGSAKITPNDSSSSSTYQPLSPPSSPGNTIVHPSNPVEGQLPPVARGFPSIPAHAGHTLTFHSKRRCISCGSDQSPCWRPSWSPSAGQLCNSCGLRYKKTNARCIEKGCGRIPAKGEWVSMKNAGVRNARTGQMEYKCLYCNGGVEVGDKH